MSERITENIKTIYNITLSKPYVNIADGIISRISFKPDNAAIMVHERKMKYQPGEKEILEAAGIKVDEIVEPRVSEKRSIEINGVILEKKSDEQFEFNVSTDVTNEDDIDYDTERKRILNECERKFTLVKLGLESSEEKYEIISFRRTICESGSCIVDDSTTKQTKLNEPIKRR